MSDVWGPARVESIRRWKWYISFVDDCSRHGKVLFMKHKSEATGRIKEHFTKIHRHFGKWPKWMRIDNGKELINEEIIGCQKRDHHWNNGTILAISKQSHQMVQLDTIGTSMSNDNYQKPTSIPMGRSYFTCKLPMEPLIYSSFGRDTSQGSHQKGTQH